MTSFPEKVLALNAALEELPHAFGGALALAWCTAQARGTLDVDINVFVPPDDVDRVAAALPAGVEVTETALTQLRRDGQTRAWWGRTPVDLFLNTTEFHEQAAYRTVLRDFGGRRVPFLACADLAVFKAFFNRTKDWADLEAMAENGRLDFEAVAGVLVAYLGPDDPRLRRLLDLRG
jgi:hypothetical protein